MLSARCKYKISINRCLPNGSRVFSLRCELNLYVQFTLILRFGYLFMNQAVSCRHITARVRSKTSLCGICGLQSGSVTRFPPSTSALCSQHHSIGAPFKCLSTSPRRTSGPSLVTFKQNNAVLWEGRELVGKMLSLCFFNLENDNRYCYLRKDPSVKITKINYLLYTFS